MLIISDISIKYKLVLMQVFTSIVILTFCLMAFMITDVRIHQSRIADTREDIAQVVGSNSVSAILSLDYEKAHNALLELSIVPDVLNSVIFDQNGEVFASYTKPGADKFIFSAEGINESKNIFSGLYLYIYKPIMKDNMLIGTICMQVELSQIETIKNEKYHIAIFTLLIGVIFSFLIAMFVQRNISVPILNLVGAMKKVKESGDYKNRVKVHGKDEINTLSLVFNDMLKNIEEREKKIIERTAELEASNQEMESFSYSVSHDLRAPIRAINGFANILEESQQEKIDDEGKELLKIITSEGKRMGQLIDDLLAFSRLGRKEIEKSDIDMETMVNSVVEEILNLNKGTYKAKIMIKDLSVARGDPALLRQVWVNLISNALKFSNHNSLPLIEIGSFYKEGSVVYYIKDNGVGFDMKYYDKLFGVFQRLHSNEEFEGTGIGLAIIKRTITRHGGNVWAEGEINKGSTFYFSLPEKG
jgi:signal transduction histidine kinase